MRRLEILYRYDMIIDMDLDIDSLLEDWGGKPEFLRNTVDDKDREHTPCWSATIVDIVNPDINIRRGWAQSMLWHPCYEQAERGLTDYDWEIRAIWAARTDFIPTEEQVDRGVRDPDPAIRLSWARRTDFTPTEEQVSIGIKDIFTSSRLTNSDIALAWGRRDDYEYTAQQLKECIENPVLAQVWIMKKSFKPTYEQIQSGLDSEMHDIWKAKAQEMNEDLLAVPDAVMFAEDADYYSI